MALLQIAEPGQSTAPHQRRLAIGIDLGTTNSLVATVQSGKAKTIPTPTANTYCHRWCVILKMVRAPSVKRRSGAAASDPLNTIVSVKRLMGRGLADVKRLGGELPYRFAGGDTVCPTC
jgi:molecular chaperone HscA